MKTNNLCTLALKAEVLEETAGDATAVAPVAAYDVHIIAERLRTVQFKVSAGGIEVIVKDGDGK